MLAPDWMYVYVSVRGGLELSKARKQDGLTYSVWQTILLAVCAEHDSTWAAHSSPGLNCIALPWVLLHLPEACG